MPKRAVKKLGMLNYQRRFVYNAQKVLISFVLSNVNIKHELF